MSEKVIQRMKVESCVVPPFTNPIYSAVCPDLRQLMVWRLCVPRVARPQGLMLVHGAKIGYFQGDIRLLMDDLVALKPTIFPVVPRLLNRMFDKVRRARAPLPLAPSSLHMRGSVRVSAASTE